MNNEAVESSAPLNRAYTDAEWRAAWEYSPRLSRLERQLMSSARHDCQESVYRAAYFAAGMLHDEGFSLLHNGGTPLLRRHRDQWIDEVLFRSPLTGVSGHYSPVSVEILVSLRTLCDVRAQYSRSVIQTSPFVASANLGELELPSCHILWNVEHPPAVEQIATRLRHDGLNWLEILADPVGIEDRVIARSLPLVDDVTGLEMVLAVGGKWSAKRVMDAWLEDPTMSRRIGQARTRLSRTFGPVYRSDDADMNLAIIGVRLDLFPRVPR